MATLASKLGQLSGKPASSSLHVHPLTEESSELGDQIAVISSEKQAKGGGLRHIHDDRSLFATNAWHSDITFETIPSDYAMLKIHTLPETGGDTLWSSQYDAYDKLSPAMASWLETLTATHDANFFHDEARRLGIKIRSGERGSPFNQGENLQAVHPVIRTNRKSPSPFSLFPRTDPCSQLSPAGRVSSSTRPSQNESTMSPRTNQTTSSTTSSPCSTAALTTWFASSGRKTR